MATIALVPPLPEKTAPDPCEIIAGLLYDDARITPEQVERATAHLAGVVPATERFRAGTLSAYWRMTATAS
jgi:hypothetical protein